MGRIADFNRTNTNVEYWLLRQRSRRLLPAMVAARHRSDLGGFFHRLREQPGGDVIVSGPTYKTLSPGPTQQVLREFIERKGLNWAYSRATGYGYRAEEKVYLLPREFGGGRIYFRSAENLGSMQGIQAIAFWLDETIDTPYQLYETLLGRIGFRGGRGLITSTPYDRGWLYSQVYRPWVLAGSPGRDRGG